MNKIEAARLCTFFRHSHYDLIQARQEDAWGSAWTFAPCDPKAAEQAARMLKRMGVRRVRHSRRACLHLDTMIIDAAIVTQLPAFRQIIIRLADGLEIYGMPCLRDECLEALERIFE